MDRDAEFADFAAARWDRLVGSAVLMGCALAAAEDLVQTTLMRAYVAWDKVHAAESQDAYVAKMLVNGFHEAHRRRRWREHPMDQLPANVTPDPAAVIADADAVRRALATLPAGQREALVLRYYTQLTEPQIAEVLRIAPGTVKSRLSRALRRLADDPTLLDFDSGRNRD